VYILQKKKVFHIFLFNGESSWGGSSFEAEPWWVRRLGKLKFGTERDGRRHKASEKKQW
jgi:hypothetical protein